MTTNLNNLITSWTRFSIVQIIQAAINNDLEVYVSGEKQTDNSVMKAFLGIRDFNEGIPSYFKEIYNFPNQVGLFSLLAAIFTHHENLDIFTESSTGNMSGVLYMKNDKHFTNLRSALVVSGASEQIYRRKPEVPYELSKLFESGEVGILAKQLLKNRLQTIGYSGDEIENYFFEISEELSFNKVLSLEIEQYRNWLNGIGISNSLYELQKNGITFEKYGKIKAFKVNQWLRQWDNVAKYDTKNRRKPQSYFYQFNIPALLLKRIYEIHNRHAFVGKKDEPFSQRKHSEERSNEIREYVKGGYPWSTISLAQKESETYKDLQMPGWLPTSLIANILAPNSLRRLKTIEDDATIKINEIDGDLVEIVLPEKIWTDKWMPLVSPIEIIDGQHRIKAFDYISEIDGSYDFPVIAFHNLDFTWQAYLFYTINIKPKRINTSLAYDLMPLLRIQDWLEHDLNGPDVYKKVRAQELTEILWRSSTSPWHDRINMLGDIGESSGGPVSQNAFINSLTSSFVKKWDGKLGGLFGGEMNPGEQDVIQWDKETQGSYLIFIWKAINSAIIKSKADWVIDLKSRNREEYTKFGNSGLGIGFYHSQSFFTTDQGIRPVLLIFNDMSFVANEVLGLNKFYVDIDYDKYSSEQILEIIIEQFRENELINEFISIIAQEIINRFDWRTPSAFDPNIREQDLRRQFQNQFRGSGGYREMRIQLLRILASSELNTKNNEISISAVAKEIQTKLGL
jgi:DGQHR domain-containing protein